MARLRDHSLSKAMLKLATLFASLKVKALVIWLCWIDGLLFSAFFTGDPNRDMGSIFLHLTGLSIVQANSPIKPPKLLLY